MLKCYVGRQQKEQEEYKSEQREGEQVSEEGMPEEHMDTTSECNTDVHEQTKTHNAGKYFNITGRHMKQEDGL